jgi:uncharacterized protein (TIGR03067 family)
VGGDLLTQGGRAVRVQVDTVVRKPPGLLGHERKQVVYRNVLPLHHLRGGRVPGLHPVGLRVELIDFALAASAPAPKDLPKKESTIVGEWRLVRANGERPVLPQVETFAADGTRTIRTKRRDGEVEERARYATDPIADPAQFDFLFGGTAGVPADKIEGIFKVEGDTLTICYQTGRGAWPKEFKEVRNVISLFVYERVKPKE